MTTLDYQKIAETMLRLPAEDAVMGIVEDPSLLTGLLRYAAEAEKRGGLLVRAASELLLAQYIEQRDRAMSALAERERELKEESELRASCRSRLAIAQENLVGAMANVNVLEFRVKSAEAEVERLRGELEARTHLLHATEQTVAQIAEQRDQAESALAAAREENERLRTAVHEDNSYYSENLRLQDDLGKLRDDLAALRASREDEGRVERVARMMFKTMRARLPAQYQFEDQSEWWIRNARAILAAADNEGGE